jgi:hypothetical protein
MGVKGEHTGPNRELAHSGKKRDCPAFSATPGHRGPNREMASCGGFPGKSADFGALAELWPGGSFLDALLGR